MSEKKLTKKEFTIKFLTEKVEKISGKKVVLEDFGNEIPLNNQPTQIIKKEKQPPVDIDRAVPIEKLKKGDVFNFPGKKSEYSFDGFNRSTGKYYYHRVDDISAFGEKKKGTLVVP